MLLPSALRKCTSLGLVADGQDPLYLLRDATFSDSSDPRDKLFGLLGLLPPVWSQRIQPRYTDSVREVYRDSIIAYIDCSRSLNYLALTGPSWIPDWSEPRRVVGWEGKSCSGRSAPHVHYASPDVLMASGVSCDIIEAARGPLSSDRAEILQLAQKLWLEGQSHEQKYPTGETLAEACAWVLNDGRLTDRWPKDGLLLPTLAEAQLPFQQLQESGDSDPKPYARLHKNIEEGSFLFRTTKGYFGVTFSQVIPSDRISLLLGCSLPALLREQSNHRHLFVGCAHVHGIMDGEAFLGSLPDGWKVVVKVRNGDYQQHFIDLATGETAPDDPRLPPLPPDWEHAIAPDLLWPDKKVEAFRNIATGEIMHSDPRWLPDAIEARGIRLESFALV
jgi:hypothetical protein